MVLFCVAFLSRFLIQFPPSPKFTNKKLQPRDSCSRLLMNLYCIWNGNFWYWYSACLPTYLLWSYGTISPPYKIEFQSIKDFFVVFAWPLHWHWGIKPENKPSPVFLLFMWQCLHSPVSCFPKICKALIECISNLQNDQRVFTNIS